MSRRWGSAGLAAVAVAALQLAAPAAQLTLDEVIARMTLAEKAGQVVVFAVGGLELTQEERRAIEQQHLGGAILFSRNYSDRSQLATLASQIQRSARNGNRFSIGALVAVDQEGGIVKRFPDMPPWYSAPEMGAAGDEGLALRQGRKTGRALREVGVNVNLAPVADLDLPPEHVMRERSFGTRHRPVGRLVAAFSRGLQSERVAAAAKHFPGLGAATINSDFGRAYVYRSKKELREIDVQPFRRAVVDGARMIMLSHGIYTNDGGNRPASVNRRIATERLRREVGFDGVAISDALEAISWRYGGSVAPACPATIRAGGDIALVTGDAGTATQCAAAIREAVSGGALAQRRLDASVRRVLLLKEWLGVFHPAPSPVPSPSPSSSPSPSPSEGLVPSIGPAGAPRKT